MSIILNPTQEKVVQEAVEWFYSGYSDLFEIAGYAGTGKSVVLNEIVKRLNLKEEDILPMAYSGQASVIMRKHGFKNACTCHSGLYNAIKDVVRDKNGKPVINKQFNIPIVRWKYIPKDFTDSNIKLIILDEAWMIPASFKRVIDRTGIRVIAAGDPGQLPPIGDNPAYLTGYNVHYLTEIMRQRSGSALVYVANLAREGKQINCGLYGDDVLVMFDTELNDDLLDRSDIILCYSNNTREVFNRYIRENILGYHDIFPRFADRVICRKNNWEIEKSGIPLVNGLTGFVSEPPTLKKMNSEKDIFSFKFIPDMANIEFDIDANIDFFKSIDHKEKEQLKSSPYIRGEFFEYAYASTVHLAQGSEYSNGIYYQEYIRPDMANAMNYTAITRFKNKMIYTIHKNKYWQIPSYKDIII